MRTSLSLSLPSTLGQPAIRPTPLSEPNGVMSKVRKTSSKSLFISRCRVMKGSPSSRYGLGVVCALRPQGMRSRMFMGHPPHLLSLSQAAETGASARLASISHLMKPSGCLVVLDGLRASAVRDLDAAGLHLLRHLAHEINRQQAIVQLRLRDLHVVRQVEGLLEGTGGDATMQELTILLLRVPLADHQQGVL